MNNHLNSGELSYPANSLIPEDTEGGLNLAEITNTILRHLPLIVGCTLITTLLALVKIANTPPSYDASFEILSEPLNIETSVTSTNYNDRSTETREEITSVELDDVQLKVIKSPKLIMRAVKSLQDKYPTLNYQNTISNLDIQIIEQSNKRNILLVAYKHSDKNRVADVINKLSQTYLDYSLEKRQSGIKRGIAFLDRQIPKVESQVENIENQIAQLRSKHNFLDPEISIQQVNNRLNSLSKEREIIAIEHQELKLKVQNLERELKTSPTESTTAIELATPRYLELLNGLKNVDVAIARKSVLFSDNSIEMKTLRGEKQQIVNLIVGETKVIRQKLTNQINILENRQKNIAAETNKLQSQMGVWSIVFQDYNHLQEKLTIANNKLNEFTLQKDALLIDAAQQEAPWQLLSPPREPSINNVSTINYLVISSSLGLLLSIGGVLLIDGYQKVIYSSAKIEQLVDLPILINIPYIQPGKKLLKLLPGKLKNNSGNSNISVLATTDSQQAKKYYAEQMPLSIEIFRSFAANLNIFNLGIDLEVATNKSLKSLVITSATPQEGKSTVALNLAIACASLGKKILIVDADLRSKDCLTTNLNLESELGLVDILSENNKNLNLKYIQKLALEKNLFLLPSGSKKSPKNPNALDSSRLLGSKKMNLLMSKVKEHFDLVIYDLSAISGFADVNLLSAKSDGVAVVAGLGKIQASDLIGALNDLKRCKAPILGIVVNNIDKNR